MRENEIPNLSPANYEVMKIIWDKGEATINDVLDAINAQRDEKVRRTTVQVQMNRLEEYGWLGHRKEGRTFFYKALRDRQPTRKSILTDIKERVFGGSPAELVKCLFDSSEKLDAEDIRELKDLLDQYQKD